MSGHLIRVRLSWLEYESGIIRRSNFISVCFGYAVATLQAHFCCRRFLLHINNLNEIFAGVTVSYYNSFKTERRNFALRSRSKYRVYMREIHSILLVLARRYRMHKLIRLLEERFIRIQAFTVGQFIVKQIVLFHRVIKPYLRIYQFVIFVRTVFSARCHEQGGSRCHYI